MRMPCQPGHRLGNQNVNMKVISTLNRIRKLALAVRFTISSFLCHWLSQPCIHLHLPGELGTGRVLSFSSLNAGGCPPRPRHWKFYLSIPLSRHPLPSLWMFPFEFPFGIRYVTILCVAVTGGNSARGVTGGRARLESERTAETAPHMSPVKFENYSTYSAYRWSAK